LLERQLKANDLEGAHEGLSKDGKNGHTSKAIRPGGTIGDCAPGTTSKTTAQKVSSKVSAISNPFNTRAS